MVCQNSYLSHFLWSIVSAMLLLSAFADDHAQPKVEEGHHGGSHFDKNMVQDKDHIMEHLEGVVQKPEADMSPQELQLHYFKMHDYDGNSLLDGLEIASAISHVHKQEGHEEPQLLKEEVITLIDEILRDDDKNDDGFIDYAEFAKSMQ